MHDIFWPLYVSSSRNCKIKIYINPDPEDPIISLLVIGAPSTATPYPVTARAE